MPESIETQTPAAPETSAPEVVNTPPATEQPGEPAAQPAYVPDYKFKYTGKNGDKWGDAEGEIDEPLRALIKSKEDEEKWKKLYSKAHGFDFVNDGRERARQELTQYQKQWSPVIDLAQKANQAFAKKDFAAFFELIGVDKQILQQHVLNDLQQQELAKTNPDQYKTIEQNRALQRQLQQYEERMSDFEQKNLQFQTQMIHNELNAAFSQPEVANFKATFDAGNGPGAFENEVRMRGKFIHDTTGQIASPRDVVQDLLKKYSFAQPSSAAQSFPPTTQSSPQPATLATQKPTIPVASGGGQSPTNKQLKSLKDLESLYNEKYG